LFTGLPVSVEQDRLWRRPARWRRGGVRRGAFLIEVAEDLLVLGNDVAEVERLFPIIKAQAEY
jgi:hypothetical protein